ncbi:MAG: DUF1211 domain-containing protein [Alphaproteobacteria bacterium]|nr:DUF1211 domain-containing protein [Alphaproteobacteria bacterium]
MGKGRLKAFSDAVVAIILTIMVLEMKVPHGADFANLVPLWPVFLSYALSFLYIGIYWNNHHHLLQATQKVNGRVLWANLHWLFWLSLLPFSTGWMGENYFAPLPVALYGAGLLLTAVAYYVLTHTLISHHGRDSAIAVAVGRDTKGKISLALYVVGILLAFVQPWLACAVYLLVAIVWLVPDSRFERSPHRGLSLLIQGISAPTLV